MEERKEAKEGKKKERKTVGRKDCGEERVAVTRADVGPNFFLFHKVYKVNCNYR